LTKPQYTFLLVDKLNGINSLEFDGALGLGLLDNFYDSSIEKKKIEFFEDFDDQNKPVNEFSIHLNDVKINN
jgi:hypothetical protein